MSKMLWSQTTQLSPFQDDGLRPPNLQETCYPHSEVYQGQVLTRSLILLFLRATRSMEVDHYEISEKHPPRNRKKPSQPANAEGSEMLRIHNQKLLKQQQYHAPVVMWELTM